MQDIEDAFEGYLEFNGLKKETADIKKEDFVELRKRFPDYVVDNEGNKIYKG